MSKISQFQKMLPLSNTLQPSGIMIGQVLAKLAKTSSDEAKSWSQLQKLFLQTSNKHLKRRLGKKGLKMCSSS